METLLASSAKNRFLKLSMTKNIINLEESLNKLNRSSDVIVIDESFDQYKSETPDRTKSVQVFSPIVINDSCDLFDDCDIPHITVSSGQCTPTNKTPSKEGNVSFNKSLLEDNVSPTKPSSAGFWSPAQTILCATPKNIPTPSTPKDTMIESREECSIKTIQRSQKKLLDDLYGDVWKSLPNLFKSKSRIDNNFEGVNKKLLFDDDCDKENIRGIQAENRQLYLSESEVKRKIRINDTIDERPAKKRLYTEKIPNTPEPKSLKKREVKSTIKKKLKDSTLTESVSFNANNELNVIGNSKATLPEKNEVTRLGFIASLTDNVPSWRCHLKALVYRDNYKSQREKLTRKLFILFNKQVFNEQLDNDMTIVWDTKLRSTAGITMNRLIKKSNGDRIHSSSIKLSTKVVDGPQRLRDTLIHEMCHAATWIIDKELRAAHGPLWKKWTTRALRVLPELEEISRCHNLEVHYKYSYKCTKCGYSYQRHSKSIDLTKNVCGYCRGNLELIINKKTKDGLVVSTPVKQAETNGFALFVKENYSKVRQGYSHAQVMKILGQQYSEKKKNKENL